MLYECSSAYYPAYQAVVPAMQLMARNEKEPKLPFEEHLVLGRRDVDPPRYLQEKS